MKEIYKKWKTKGQGDKVKGGRTKQRGKKKRQDKNIWKSRKSNIYITGVQKKEMRGNDQWNN